MRHLALAAMILAFAGAAAGQAAAAVDPQHEALQRLERGDYLGAVATLRAARPTHGVGPEGSGFRQELGTYLSYLGDQAGAYEAFAEGEPDRWRDPEPPDLTGVACEDAVAAIAAAAAGRQAVFVNEAHHVPKHRALTHRLLRALKAQGFRYFAAETFNARQRPGPTPQLGRSGHYTDEPLYADLIREAVAQGYTLVHYEHPSPVQNERERGQAQNLEDRILAKDPGAKLLVHAGYGHIDEAGVGTWVPMARAFREITGLDPLTVDQTTFDEAGRPQLEPVAYAPLLARFRPSGPVVLRDASGAGWSGGEPGGYDLRVLHPRTSLHQGRPAWLELGGARRPVAPPAAIAAQSKPGSLLQAFVAGEPEPRVPLDQYLVPAGRPLPPFMLRPGPEYEFRVQAK